MTFLPIIQRELRVVARKPGTYWLRFGAAMGAFALWAILAGRGSGGASLGAATFYDLSLAGEVACLFCGVLLTADCISREKREETLGLLFLTDLKGHDVVLGKVVAASLHFVYALLAVLPLLGMTLLLGGVTGGEFWRMVLVLLATLVFSLGLGVLVSTYTRQPRYAMGGALLVLIFVTCVIPMLSFSVRRLSVLLYADPVRAWEFAQEAGYQRVHSAKFWLSLATVFGLGAGFLAWASLALPRVWQEGREGAWGRARSARLSEATFGTDEFREALRRRLLGLNPYYWLASRDRSLRNMGSMLFGSMMALWLCLYAGVFIAPRPTNLEAFGAGVFIAIGLNLIYKYMVSWEASRRLHEDRESGALELLLVTPLSERQIMAGQTRALRRNFIFPALVLLAAGAGLMWLVGHPDTMKVRMVLDGTTQVILFTGAMLMVLLDFFALTWVGMWMAMRLRKHHNAVLCTLALVVLLPWVASLPVWLWVWGGASGPGENPNEMLVLWFVLGAINDVVLVLMARVGLGREFRRLASGDVAPEPDTEAELEVVTS